MKLFRVGSKSSVEEAVAAAVGALAGGGVVIYPTDTVYGIGCILEEKPVRRVYSLKGRSFSMPLSVAFSGIEMVRHYTELTPDQEEYIKKHVKEPYTFIVAKKNVPDCVTAGKPTVGVRIPAETVCEKLIKDLGAPITSTSANASGRPAPARIEDVDEKLMEKADLVLDAGPCRLGRPSTVVDLTRGGVVLR